VKEWYHRRLSHYFFKRLSKWHLGSDFVSKLEKYLRDLLEAGLSSPADEDENSNTILYYSFRIVYMACVSHM
jgi:hypothetical protein